MSSVKPLQPPTEATRQQRPRVLIVATSNKFIDIFAESRDAIDVKVLRLPETSCAKADILAEQLALLELPPVWARVRKDGWRVGMATFEPWTVQDEYATRYTLDAMRAIENAIHKSVGGAK